VPQLRLPVRTRALLTLLALSAVGVAALLSPAPAIVPQAPDKTDVAAFQAVVRRLRAGAEYYPSMSSELRSRGYPTSSAFNWRTPLHLTAISVVPDALSRGLLFALLLVLAATIAAVRPPLGSAWTASAVLQAGVLVSFAAPSSVFLSETWAGVLVGISLCAYAQRQNALAIGLGILALFVRELAAPYCVVCATIAAANRRGREVVAWACGASAYAAYYASHVTQVWAHQLVADPSNSSSWLVFGGLPFLLATIQWLGWLFVLPKPFLALTLVLIVGALVNARADLHLRATSAAYVAFFLIAGHPFNHYWGLVVAPMWAIACGYGLEAVIQAVRTVLGPSTPWSSLAKTRAPFVTKERP
jgi:hypothetical protein